MIHGEKKIFTQKQEHKSCPRSGQETKSKVRGRSENSGEEWPPSELDKNSLGGIELSSRHEV